MRKSPAFAKIPKCAKIPTTSLHRPDTRAEMHLGAVVGLGKVEPGTKRLPHEKLGDVAVKFACVSSQRTTFARINAGPIIGERYHRRSPQTPRIQQTPGHRLVGFSFLAVASALCFFVLNNAAVCVEARPSETRWPSVISLDRNNCRNQVV